MATDAQRKANAKYDKTHTQSVMLKLNKQTDADVLGMLESVDNRQGYIKDLIRQDLRGNGEILSTKAIRFLIIPIVKKYNISKVYLFGSYARGEETRESDIDLLIEGGDIDKLSQILDLEESLSNALGKNVDVVQSESVKKDGSRSNRRFYSHLERDKVLIYEKA